MMTPPPKSNVWRIAPQQEQCALTDGERKDWIKLAIRILTDIQIRDNLEKTVIMRDYGGNERRILIKPKSLEELEGSFCWFVAT
jgi:hypothetical protein